MCIYIYIYIKLGAVATLGRHGGRLLGAPAPRSVFHRSGAEQPLSGTPPDNPAACGQTGVIRRYLLKTRASGLQTATIRRHLLITVPSKVIRSSLLITRWSTGLAPHCQEAAPDNRPADGNIAGGVKQEARAFQLRAQDLSISSKHKGGYIYIYIYIYIEIYLNIKI